MNKEFKKRGLFVLHEGIGSTIFNSQVIEHVMGMEKEEIFLDILCYNTLSKTWKTSLKNQIILQNLYPEINICLHKGVNIFYPFSILLNAYLLYKFLRKNKANYTFIHARADFSTLICLITKPLHNLPVFWDCRGDSISELEDSLSRKNFGVRFIGNFFFIPREHLIIKFICKYSSGAIFVSSKLKNLYLEKILMLKSFVIPCLVSEHLFYFDSTLRSRMRLKFGIEKKHKVFLYSGSMIAYQAISKQLNMYRQILSDPDNIIFILTPDFTAAKEYFRTLPQDNLRVLSIDFKEMNSFYNMADFAFLLRDNKRLNTVASPTKFGEYCLTGLPVIMNDTVEQAQSIGMEIGNCLSHLHFIKEPFKDNRRESISKNALIHFSRSAHINKYVELYNT